MNVNRLVATRPGASSGSTIERSTRSRPAPSIAPASSSSTGIAATYPRSIHNANGRHQTVYTSTRPSGLFTSPTCLSTRKTGITMRMNGNTWLSRIQTVATPRSFVLNRANAYAAGSDTTVTITVVSAAT